MSPKVNDRNRAASLLKCKHCSGKRRGLVVLRIHDFTEHDGGSLQHLLRRVQLRIRHVARHKELENVRSACPDIQRFCTHYNQRLPSQPPHISPPPVGSDTPADQTGRDANQKEAPQRQAQRLLVQQELGVSSPEQDPPLCRTTCLISLAPGSSLASADRRSVPP